MSTITAGLPKQREQPFFRTIQPWVVCFSAALFFFFTFIQVNMFNALAPSLIRYFHITDTQLGYLSSTYFVTDVVFLLPAGIILDRISTRWCMLGAMTATTLATLLFAFVLSPWQAELCRLVVGAAGAFCLLGCVRLASRWFPPRRMALVVGLIVTFAMLGGMCAQTPLAVMTDKLGWRHALMVDGMIGLVLLAIMFLFVRDNPPGQDENLSDPHSAIHEKGFWGALREAVMSLQNWMAGIYASLINIPIFILGATWGSMYLMQVDKMTRDQSTTITSMLFLGLIVGCPVIGWISDRLARRKAPMIVGTILSIITILIIMYGSNLGFVADMGLFFILGFVISVQVIAYPLIAESNPRSITGTAEGVASVLIMAGGLLIPAFPALMDIEWNHLIVNHIPVYSTSDYHLGLAMLPAGFVIALVASFFIRETRCQQQH